MSIIKKFKIQLLRKQIWERKRKKKSRKNHFDFFLSSVCLMRPPGRTSAALVSARPILGPPLSIAFIHWFSLSSSTAEWPVVHDKRPPWMRNIEKKVFSSCEIDGYNYPCIIPSGPWQYSIHAARLDELGLAMMRLDWYVGHAVYASFRTWPMKDSTDARNVWTLHTLPLFNAFCLVLQVD